MSLIKQGAQFQRWIDDQDLHYNVGLDYDYLEQQYFQQLRQQQPRSTEWSIAEARSSDRTPKDDTKEPRK